MSAAIHRRDDMWVKKLGPGHVVATRSAAAFMPDIEQALTADGMDPSLAPTIADLCDLGGFYSVDAAIRGLRSCLAAYAPADPSTTRSDT